MTNKPDMISHADAIALCDGYGITWTHDAETPTAKAIGDAIRALTPAQVAVKPLTKDELAQFVAENPRDPLMIVAFAAWLNVRPDQIPTENRFHTCPATKEAWGRVAESIKTFLTTTHAPDPAQIREAALREAADVDWSYGRDTTDTGPDCLTDWQRGLVSGQKAMRDAILALIPTPPAVSDDVAALVEAATALADWAEQGRACGDWGNWDWSEGDEYSRTRAALAKLKGGAA